jgi:hypothetical protein
MQTLSQPAAAPAPQRMSAAAAPKPADSDNPAPPRDAQWTILCAVINGPGHVERARLAKDDLVKSSPMKTWYVTHDDQQSTLYYGYYRSYNDANDAKETARIHADRDRIAKMQDQIGVRPFKDARPVPLAGPDPVAPAEYNLLNAQGAWSLQIAAYQGQGRKEAAVESVLKARKMGVEAYYHHGPSVSIVCIGHWPEEAIRKQEFDGGAGIDRGDRDRPLMVLGPGAEIPESMREQLKKSPIERETGKPIQVLEQRIEIVDPTMRATMEQYPKHSLNGMEENKPTAIVPIPRETSVLQADPNYRPGLLTPQQVQPRGGQLRSIGQ